MSWCFTVLYALGAIQCAQLNPFGDYCGNGAVNPTSEDCDGQKSFSVPAAGSYRKLTCGATCRFTCGKDSQCPSEDWACRDGECVALEPGDSTAPDGGPKGLAAPVEAVGPAATAHVADFDDDGFDDIVAVPVGQESPLVVHFSPLDPTRSSATTLFPAPASALVSAPRGEPARLVAALGDGTQLTVVHTSTGLGGQRTRALESEVVPTSEIKGASVNFLFRRNQAQGDMALAWVYGAVDAKGNIAKDSLQRVPLLRRVGESPVLTRDAIDAEGKPLAERRIVVGVPPDKRAPCGRIAVFTRNADAAKKGTLEIITPEPTRCDWTPPQTVTLAARYPATRGPAGAFAADLKGDGVYDLVVNGSADLFVAQTMKTWVLHNMEGEFEEFEPAVTALSVPIAAAPMPGYTHPVLLMCELGAASLTLAACFNEGSAVSLGLRFPNEDGSKYPRSVTLGSGRAVAAGFADLNGDGRQDVWAWFAGTTGVRVFENTPDGLFASPLLDHGSATPRSVVSGPLDNTSPFDLLAVTQFESKGGTTAGSTLSSTVQFTGGRSDMAALAPKVIAHLGGRASPTFLAEVGAPGSVQLATCVAGNCDEAQADLRAPATFHVANLRAIYGDWFATPASLTCEAGRGVDFTHDVHKAATRIGALQLTARETQVVTVQNAENANIFRPASARWARLGEGTPLPPTCDTEGRMALVESAWIAVAPASTGDPNHWLTLTSAEAVPGASERAFLLAAGQTGVAVPFLRPAGEADRYQAIAAMPIDLDNDRDTDFVVLALKDGINGREAQANDRRVRFYVNVPCDEGPGGVCLLVKDLDDMVAEQNLLVEKKVAPFGAVSGDALAWAQSPLEAAHFATVGDPGVSRDWWLGAVAGNTASGTGTVKTARVRVEGRDEKMNFTLVDGSTSEAALPTASVAYQHVAWGDFDGDTALDLLYVSDRGSRIYKRAEKAKKAK